MATAIVAVGCYYGYTASGGPVGRRPGDRQVDDPQHGAGAPDRHDGLPGLLGSQSKGADRGLTRAPCGRSSTNSGSNLTPWRFPALKRTWIVEDLTFPSGKDSCAAWLYAAGERRPGSDRGHGPRAVRDAARPARAVRRALRRGGLRGARLRPSRLRRQRRRARPVRARAASSRTGARRSPSPARCPASTPTGVATFGSSMGGGNALAAAADGPARRRRDQPGAVPRHRPPGAPLVAARSPRGCCVAAARGGHLPAVGQPDEAAFINAPGARGGLAARRRDRRGLALAQPRLLALAARASLPARSATRAKLHCPWLVCVGEADRVARPGPAIAAARRAPHGELRIYPGVDHFDIYDGPEHEAVVADEIDFLHRHLG